MAATELKIFNRAVGTYDGWDDMNFMTLQFYDFVPANGFDMPAGTLCVSYEDGVFETYDGEGNVVASKDFLIVMNGLAAVQHRNS